MFEFLQRVLGRDTSSAEVSKNTAKERLKLVLVHDRASMSPQVLNSLKEELIDVISKYMDIDKSGLEVNLANEDESVALVCNIPILKMKRKLS